MKRINKLFAVTACAFLAAGAFAQEEEEAPVHEGYSMELAKSATIGVEAGTTFEYDVNDGSSGLETKVGIQFYLPLFDKTDRGVVEESYAQPGVRLVVKDMCFQWLESYFTTGGNYAQDNVNSWSSRPLVLTYGDITADLVYKNFFLQVAGTTNPMQVDNASINSIFDDVMDTDDRWYIKKQYALYSNTRYNKLGLPLLGSFIQRDAVDTDYSDDVSGQIGFGVEYSKFTAMAKAASLYSGRDNDENEWLFGLDSEFYPVEDMSISVNAMAGLHCENSFAYNGTAYNPLTAGISADYKIKMGRKSVLKPYIGFDYFKDLEGNLDDSWEAGIGTYFYTRGEDFLASHRDIDYDEIVPVGFSLGVNAVKNNSLYSDDDIHANLIFSAFELADRKASIRNLGYFVELEMCDLGGDDMHTAIAGQIEYLLGGKYLPYLFGKYYPELSSNGEHMTGDNYVDVKVGCYMTPVQYFSLDVSYQLSTCVEGDGEDDKGLISVACTIRL
ncbi:hypothetical protein [Treponema sp.]|uniref:hypothetical protein n=1 Tax=Treponema sp. TaxID=166 RepID=UPI0025D43840|nr:hypothetical protein [Treponema sp.]MCR5217921.1 hypothetical protein [Treponema sp.]